MRCVVLSLILMVLATASCTRRPVQHDLPSSQNSDLPRTAGHSHQMTNSPGAVDAPYDLQFIDTMIVHHQGAIDMAQLVATRAQHEEIRQLAKSIISDQQREIAEMKALRSNWFGASPQAINMELPGMHEGMSGMDLARLDSLKGNDFDLEFIRQMVPHHEGAVTMAKELLAIEAHAELKTLTESIVRTQTTEVEQMKDWQKDWDKK
jgi:uncharacterized protein (DUF305 family)